MSRFIASPALIALLAASAANAQWVGPSGPQNLISYTTGNAYVGTAGSTNSVVRFDVVDNAQSGRVIGLHSYIGTPQNGVRTTAIWGETNNPTGRALQGFNFATTGSGAGIWAETAANAGTGIRARATSTSGSNVAGYFDTASNGGIAVYGDATATTGAPIGVWGKVATTSNGYAGYFSGGKSYFEGKVGIGTQNPTSYLTVSVNDAGPLILGSNGSVDTSSITNGVAGVTGQATSANPGAYAAGVRGYSQALGSNGVGVIGYHSGTGFGVYGGTGNAGGYSGVFDSNVSVTGNLAKGAGSFRIDHPLDPENKYLYHSFVESPDMMNIYNGIATTDEQGYATIDLPEWFDTLNRDFRYQLTVIDESDAGWILAKVVRKMVKNQFTIRTNYPNVEVSWQITGIRQDKYANAHRIPVEVDKEKWNRGRYVHPEVFGKPRNMMVSYQVDAQGNAVSPYPTSVATPVTATSTTAAARPAATNTTVHAASAAIAPKAPDSAATAPLTPAAHGGR